MPAPRISSRELRRQQEFENDIAQQGADQRQQAGMLQMLESLYGIGQQEQFAPEKLRALQAETAGREAGTAGQVIQNEYMPRQAQQGLDIGQSNLDTSELNRMLARAQEERTGAMHPLQMRAGEAAAKGAELGLPFIEQREQSNLDSAELNRQLARAQEGRTVEEHPLRMRAGELANTGAGLTNKAAEVRIPYLEPQIQAELRGSQLANQASTAKMPFIVPSAQSDLLDAATRRRYISTQTEAYPITAQSEAHARNVQSALASQALPEFERYHVQTHDPYLGEPVRQREAQANERRAAGRAENERQAGKAPLVLPETGLNLPPEYGIPQGMTPAYLENIRKLDELLKSIPGVPYLQQIHKEETNKRLKR